MALGYFNRCGLAATVTGGDWLAALPAQNVTTPERAAVARSTTAASADTKLNIDLGAAYPVRVVAFDAHNLSSAGQWLVKLGTTSGASDVYNGSLVNWLQATGTEVAITEHGASLGGDLAAIIVLAQAYTARHLTIEIVDTGNADGHIDIGHVFAGPALVPAVNPEHGQWADTHVDPSTNSRSRSGALWSDPVRRRKAVQLSLGALSAAEADTVHELQRVLGTVGRVLFVPDIADAAKTQRYGFIGVMTELTALENPYYATRGTALRLEQG